MSHESTLATRPVSKTFSMLGAALSLLVPVAFGGCGGSSSEPTTPAVAMVAGAMLPRTGVNANSDWISAVELAASDINAAIKAANMPQPLTFSLLERDTASDETKAHDAMAEYFSLGAKIAITEASNAAIGSNKYNYEQPDDTTRLPVVSFTATSATLNNATATDPVQARQDALRDTANWFYRTCPISNNLSAIRLNEMFGGLVPGTNGDINHDGTVKVVWIGTNDTSTVASITGDQKAVTTYLATPAGMAASPLPYVAKKVVFDPGTDPTAFNYSDQIAAATSATDEMGNPDNLLPDLIINKALPNVAIPFIKAYKQNAANTINIFQDGSFRRNTLLAALGSSADGQVGVSNIAFSNNASGTLFAQEQQAKTGWAPAAYESQGYDAMALALLAMIKASVTNAAAGNLDPTTMTGAEVRDALNQLNDQDPANAATRVTFNSGAAEFTKAIKAIVAGLPVDYEGASGNVNFDANGDTRDIAALWKIQGGQFTETQTFDCVTDNTCKPIQ